MFVIESPLRAYTLRGAYVLMTLRIKSKNFTQSCTVQPSLYFQPDRLPFYFYDRSSPFLTDNLCTSNSLRLEYCSLGQLLCILKDLA